MAQSYPRVDSGHEEALAAAAGEPLEGWVEADVEPEPELSCEEGLGFCEVWVGAGELDGGLGEEADDLGGALFVFARGFHAVARAYKELTVP